MKTKKLIYLFLSLYFIVACSNLADKNSQKMTITPPVAKKNDAALVEHGRKRIDPYFWMRLSDKQKKAETPDDQTRQVLGYLENENDYLKKVMTHTEDFQETLYKEIVGRIKKTDESVPYFSNGYWYYVRYEENKEHRIYCRKKRTLKNEEEVILNVNELAEKHSYYQVSGLSISADNKILAFGEDTLSRRIYTIRFRNLETGKLLDDKIENASSSGAWTNDSKTYFYTSKNKVSLLSEKVLRHTLGSKQSSDVTVYQEKDPAYYIGVYKSKSNDYIIIWNSSTLSNDYHILSADNPTGKFMSFTPREEDHEYSIYHFEDKFYIVTNWDAKNFRLMETSESNTEKSKWKEVIPHRKDVLLETVELFKKHIVIEERKEGLTNLRIIDQKNGYDHYIAFDDPAYTVYISTNEEFDTNFLRFGYTSLTTPNSTYDYDMSSKEKKLMKQSEVVGGHDPSEYQSERVWATSRDGVRIPISLVYKKGFEKKGNGPILLYAYGSYGSTIDAYFSSVRLSLLNRGFAFAIAHVRGGQMMGRQWYEDGKMFKKKNTFNDYIDCSRFLIEEKYTSPQHLYAMGGSAGGLLMGAIVNMNPELYNGVVAAVPFVDVVSTMWDESIPLTTNEFNEWGNPKELASYEYMLSYSPYDNVKEQNYPNMLVTTGFFDSQVQYWEPAKWVAKLRDKKTDKNVLLLDTEMKVGHSGASGRFERYKNTALEYAFILDLEKINK